MKDGDKNKTADNRQHMSEWLNVVDFLIANAYKYRGRQLLWYALGSDVFDPSLLFYE